MSSDGKAKTSVLWWGRFDPQYSRNRVLRDLMLRAGCEIRDFRPLFSRTADLEAGLGRIPRPDLVWVPCFRHRDVAAAARWAKKANAPLVFDPLVSAYQKQVFEHAKFDAGSADARKLLESERQTFSLPDLVVADTRCHADFFRDELHVPEERLSVVYVGADGTFTAAPPPRRRPDEPVEVLFYGSFITLHGARTIVRAARLSSRENVRWTLLGDGPEKQACMAEADGLANVAFEDPLPYEKLCERIHKADVLLGVFGDTAQASRVMPNKFFQSLASGRPVITRVSSAYPQAALESSSVQFVPPDDPAGLANAVRNWSDAKVREAATAGARRLFDAEFSGDVVLRQLVAAMSAAIRPKLST